MRPTHREGPVASTGAGHASQPQRRVTPPDFI